MSPRDNRNSYSISSDIIFLILSYVSLFILPMFILTSFLLTLKILSVLILLSTMSLPLSRFLFVTKMVCSLDFKFVVSGTAMKSSNFLLYSLLDMTSAGLTLELFRSEKGNNSRTISLCEIVYYHLLRYWVQISSPLFIHILRRDRSDKD